MWEDRRVKIGVQPASWFEANEKNFRTHPRSQGEYFNSVANAVGLLDAIKVNLRSSPLWGDLQNQPIVINGHMRVIEALKKDENTMLPVDYYDLSPEEERLALIAFDYLSKMAGTDRDVFASLLEDVMNSETIEIGKDEKLEELLQMMAQDNNIFLDDIEDDLPEIEDPSLEPDVKGQKAKIIVTCDPEMVEKIGDYLNSINVDWTRRD